MSLEHITLDVFLFFSFFKAIYVNLKNCFLVKVDVHINNNGGFGHSANGHAARSEIVPREPSEHAYEQICIRQEEIDSGEKKSNDNVSDSR